MARKQSDYLASLLADEEVLETKSETAEIVASEAVAESAAPSPAPAPKALSRIFCMFHFEQGQLVHLAAIYRVDWHKNVQTAESINTKKKMIENTHKVQTQMACETS